MYQTIKAKSQSRTSSVTTTTAVKGLNKRDLPQLLDTSVAQEIINYIIAGEGRLEKRKGYTEKVVAGGGAAYPITALCKWGDVYAFAYNTGLYIYDPNAIVKIITVSGFTGTVLDLEASQSFLYVAANGVRIGYVAPVINYDNHSGGTSIWKGFTVTGQTSGATGIAVGPDTTSATTGTFEIIKISGTFLDNEVLHDSQSVGTTWISDMNGVIGYRYSVYTGSDDPRAICMTIIGTRMYCGGADGRVQYSTTNGDTYTPYSFNSATTVSSGGLLVNSKLGDINTVQPLGDAIICGGNNGKFAFKIETFDSGGVISKKDVILLDAIDHGMKASIQTHDGLFYINDQGLWQMTSVGEPGVKYSEQEQLISKILGEDYFDGVSLSNVSMIMDDVNHRLYVTYQSSGGSNNDTILVYDLEHNAYTTFDDWEITSLINDNETIYAGSATHSKIFKLFDGDDDNGNNITTSYEQELSIGPLNNRKSLNGQYVQGRLSATSNINVDFDIYNVDSEKEIDKLKLDWTRRDTTTPGLLDDSAGRRSKIANLKRVILHINESSKVPHQINWVSLDITDKGPIRNRQLTT